MYPRKISESGSCLSIAVFLFSFLFIFITGGFADPAEQCLDCHEETWDEGRLRSYRHQPFREQKCKTCHLDSLPEIENSKNRGQRENPERRRVKWAGRNFSPSRTHWFRFYAPEGHDALFMEVVGRRGEKFQEQTVLPPLEDLPRYDDDQTPPVIGNVEIMEVKKGVFLSAVIGWRTDEPGNSVVEYGVDRINRTSPLDDVFTTDHRVVINGIKFGTNYQYRVISEDLFGNRAVSEKYILSTDKEFSKLESSADAVDRQKIKVEIESYRSNGRYLVRVDANKPVKVALGTLQVYSASVGYVKAEDSRQEIKHPVTKDAFHLNLSTCYGCHRKYQEGMSHPVNVYPKKGIVIPPEYPTLPDGRMTCSSCHTRHASNNRNRLVKSSNKELCEGCHKGMS